MAACGLPAATGFLTHGDRSNWVPAFFLVGALQEVRKLLRPCARLGDDGITYAEEWFTRRAGFADVASWAHYREGAVMLFTTHDGRSWGLNLGEVARADRARALAHLTARLPPATILESVDRMHGAFGWRQGAAEIAWFAALVLATMQLIDVASTWRGPARSISSPAHRPITYASGSTY